MNVNVLRYMLPRLFVILVLAGCAGERYHREGLSLLEDGKIDEGLSALAKAVDEEPTNAEFRKDLLSRRAAVVERLQAAAKAARQAGNAKEAESLYRRALSIDNANARAREGLVDLARDDRHAEIVAAAREAFKAGDADRALTLMRPIHAENPEHPVARALKREIEEHQARRLASEPTLKSTHTRPINLEFRDANVRMVFEGLARTTGINFILDKDVRPDLRTTVFLKNSSIEDGIDLILQTSQLQKKVLNSNTVLIYPATPEKIKDYQDLVLKAFYLKNADAKQVQNTLKTLLKTKDLVIDEKLNLLVMRDTPEAIRLAEKLVAIHDLSEPEVMLEVEVLEVQRNRLLNLGIQWPNQLSLTPLSASGGTSLTVNDLKHLKSNRIGAGIGGVTVNARSDVTDVNLLANPKIRARNREKAKILVGDKIPVVTTTTTATGLVSDSVQYLDVGLKVELEPDIHLDDEVAIKVGLEVSSLGPQVKTSSGTIAYQIGTRNANTVLRLKDGETQILAGLINEQDRKAASGVPGLTDLPVLGRLFASHQDDRNKTEIVLSITPHVVRNVVRPDAESGEFWSGTESTLRTRPLSLTSQSPKTEAGDSVGGDKGNTVSNLPSAPGAAAKAVGLTWQGPNQVKSGEIVKIALRIKADGAIRSLPFQASFDAAAFQAMEVTEGDFFKQDGGTTSFSSNIDATAGKIFVSVTRADVAGASGEDTVAVVALRALAAKSPAEVRLLSAAPIVQGATQPKVLLPPPFAINVVP